MAFFPRLAYTKPININSRVCAKNKCSCVYLIIKNICASALNIKSSFRWLQKTVCHKMYGQKTSKSKQRVVATLNQCFCHVGRLTCFADPLKISLKGLGKVLPHSQFPKGFPPFHTGPLVAKLPESKNKYL